MNKLKKPVVKNQELILKITDITSSGEGIGKVDENFAEEVAKHIKG